MSSTVTALFDSRAEAEAAKERLRSARVDADNVQVYDKSSSGHSDSGYSTHSNRGFWEKTKNAYLPDQDRHTYEEGVRRGGALLTADVDDDDVAEVVRILEEADTVDIDERANQWRSSGWDYAGGGTAGAAAGHAGSGERSAMSFGDRGAQEEVIPVVEEQLVVGKRDVSRGGVRVRSYVCEVPVHEQIRLRQEHVEVERRPVNERLSGADADAFRERTVEMTETSEEAVVAKEARVTEEVVVSKTAQERVEEIDDTVRRTEVDIDRDTDTDRDGSRRR